MQKYSPQQKVHQEVLHVGDKRWIILISKSAKKLPGGVTLSVAMLHSHWATVTPTIRSHITSRSSGQCMNVIIISTYHSKLMVTFPTSASLKNKATGCCSRTYHTSQADLTLTRNAFIRRWKHYYTFSLYSLHIVNMLIGYLSVSYQLRSLLNKIRDYSGEIYVEAVAVYLKALHFIFLGGLNETTRTSHLYYFARIRPNTHIKNKWVRGTDSFFTSQQLRT